MSSSPITSTNGREHIETAQKIVLAGVSNMGAACFTNPFDLIKVRQQLTGSSAPPPITSTILSSSSTSIPIPIAKPISNSWPSILISMIRTEGPLSLYKGLSASLSREASYSAIRFGIYDICKDGVLAIPVLGGENGILGGKDGFGTKLGGGLMSGMIGSSIANPADLLKVRMQAAGAVGTLRSHVTSIYGADGIKGLYRAVGPTMLRAGLLTAFQLGVYDHAKYTLMADFPGTFKEGFGTHLAASAAAGFACSAASAPVDVLKIRMMSDATHQYKNAFHCAGLLLKNEGPLAFYKGFSMCFLRLWPHSVLSLLFYENFRKLAGLNPI